MRQARAMALVVLPCVLMPVTASAQTILTAAGQVLGPDGEPVSGAKVLVQYTGSGREFTVRDGISDAEGRFASECELASLRQPVQVAARKPGLAVDCVRMEPGDPVTLRLGSDPVAFSGTITDPEGNPIGGAEVSVRSIRVLPEVEAAAAELRREQFYLGDESFLAATTDEAGRFTIPDLPAGGELTVTARAAGRGRFTMARESAPADTADFAIVLNTEAVIVGRITHEGRPVGRAEVSAAGGLTTAKTESAEDGTYRLSELAVGSYRVQVDADGDLVAPWVGPVVVEPGDTLTDVDIALTAGAVLEGTVTHGETGEPVAEAVLFATAGNYSAPACSDVDGRYSLRVPAGAYAVDCYSPEGAPYARTEPDERRLEVTEGETRTALDFRVWGPRDYVVRGRVVGPDGDPVAGAKVGTYVGLERTPPSYQGYFTAAADAEGKFELKLKRVSRLPGAGGWPLLAMETERRLAGVAIMPESDVPDDPVEVTVTPGAYINGTMEDTDGQPLVGTMVQLSIGPTGMRSAYSANMAETDERGAFRIGPLPTDARYHVSPGAEFEDRMVGARYTEVRVAPGEEVELQPLVVNLAGRSLVCWVRDVEQRPVSNALVCVTGLDDPARTDAEGRAEFTGLPVQGALWVVAVHPTEPLCVGERVDPGWELEPGLILQEPGSAEGRVVDQVGRPVTEAKVLGFPRLAIEFADGGQSLRGQRWHSQVMSRVANTEWALRATTDETGMWRCDGLIGGVEYRFQAEVGEEEGAVYGRSDSVAALPGEMVDVGDIKLRRR